MTLAQGSGAGLGAVLAGVLVTSLQHFVGYSIDTSTAIGIATAGIAGLGTLFHAVEKRGVLGLWRVFLRGTGAAGGGSA